MAASSWCKASKPMAIQDWLGVRERLLLKETVVVNGDERG
ncbi:hypothetical protein SynROS8604_00966 [Synechococcus sp. ROS8604]|nr:hypothetical protein SynROS8604_00966 [Synechococcus sp. ROS8604]